VPRGHQPRDNAHAHGAEPDETDVHSFTSQSIAGPMMTRDRREGQRTFTRIVSTAGDP
jgi:hypothetical protein